MKRGCGARYSGGIGCGIYHKHRYYVLQSTPYPPCPSLLRGVILPGFGTSSGDSCAVPNGTICRNRVSTIKKNQYHIKYGRRGYDTTNDTSLTNFSTKILLQATPGRPVCLSSRQSYSYDPIYVTVEEPFILSKKYNIKMKDTMLTCIVLSLTYFRRKDGNWQYIL